MIRGLGAAVLAVTLTAACARPDENGFLGGGLGPQTTRTVDWSGADTLTVQVPGEITFVQSDTPSLTISGPTRLVDDFVADGGRLSFRSRAPWRWRDDEAFRIEVAAPDVTRFVFASAHKARIRGYEHDEIEIEMNGAGDLIVTGDVEVARVSLNGVGRIDLSGLRAEDARIEMNGTGSITARPTENAEVAVNGLGEVELLERPDTLRRQIRGLGAIKVPG